jgi:hypothetical protein
LEDDNSPSIKKLKQLEICLVWEARLTYVIAAAAPMWYIYPPAGLALGGMVALMLLLCDSAFSGLVTFLFLAPIVKVIPKRAESPQQSTLRRRLQKTK